jgi:cytochrome b561
VTVHRLIERFIAIRFGRRPGSRRGEGSDAQGNKAALPAVLLSSDIEIAELCHADGFFAQPTGRAWDGSCATARPPWTHETPVDARRPSFDSVTIRLHWATAVLVLAMFATACLHALAELWQSDFAPFLLQSHRSFGVTIWTVTMLRLAWRLTSASLPPFPPTQMTRRHRTIIKLSEYALYALLLGQPATRLAHHAFWRARNRRLGARVVVG